MGPLPSRLQDSLHIGKDKKVVMMGLNNAGKTTLLFKMINTTDKAYGGPTIGFNVETVTPNPGTSLTLWDVAGHERQRHLWKHYYWDAKGLVFVLDSSDQQRFQEAKKEFLNVVKDPEMGGVPVVVVANKQDLPDAASTDEVAQILELENIPDLTWRVQGASATKGEGIDEAMREMVRLIKIS